MSENDSEIKKKIPTAARKAVNGVKAAPQKIVEHALNTAISTVEKAAQTDVKRTAKRAEKTAKKLEKVKKMANAAENEAKRASAMSSNLDKLNRSEQEKSPKLNLKNKLKEIISPKKEQTFYYDRRQLIVLMALYMMLAVFVYIVSDCLVRVNVFDNWFLFGFMVLTQILTLLALASVVFVTTVPQTLAVVNKEGIQIDHNALLRWQDVDVAEEKYTSFLLKRPFMALHVSEDNLKKYKLTFMQKLCKKNIFTPFSIPMYAMRPEDAAEIRNLVKHYAKYKDNRN